MKRMLFLAVSAILVLLVVSTTQTDPAETPNTNPPAIIADGELYISTGQAMPAEIDPSAIIGKATGVVSGSTWPTEEGQINFPEPDAEYAKVTNGVAVLIGHEWVLFVPQDGE